VHLTSFAMFVFATVHGFTAGADNKNLAVQWVALTGGLLVFLLVMFRLLAPRRAARIAGATATAKRTDTTREEEPNEAERIEAALRRRSAEPSRLAASDRGRAS